MPTPEEDNHEARKEANTNLSELNDKVEKLKPEDVNANGLPPGARDGLRKFKEMVEEEIDKAQEAINTNHILKADASLRSIRAKIDATVKEGPIKEQIVKSINDFNRGKRKITAPPLEPPCHHAPEAEKGHFISTEDFVRLSTRDILETSLSNLGLPSDRLKLIQSFGLRTVGDLVEWRNSKAVKEHIT